MAALVTLSLILSTFRVVLAAAHPQLRTLRGDQASRYASLGRGAFAIGAIVGDWRRGQLDDWRARGGEESGLGTSIAEVLVGVSVWPLALAWQVRP